MMESAPIDSGVGRTQRQGQAGPPALSLRGVEVVFTGKCRLRMADLHVRAGEHVLIHGPSGHGKTTLLHLLAGLLLPRCGEVLVGRDNLCKLSERARCALRRRDFGILFQTLNLLDHLTAQENVMLGSLGLNSNRAGAAAMTALAQVGMAEWANAPTASLSLGQQQRVAAARVLAAAPRVILADEPTSSLDQANADLMMDALFQAARQATLVMVSHDVRIHSRFSRVMAIDEVLSP